jgi:hypothetical protein
VYALMERQPYAAEMQEEMIRQIEAARPEYVVYVQDEFSWLEHPDSEKKIREWWPRYWAANLELVRTLNTRLTRETVDLTGMVMESKPAQSGPAQSGSYLLVFKRKSAP